jgi:hypothetical protein
LGALVEDAGDQLPNLAVGVGQQRVGFGSRVAYRLVPEVCLFMALSCGA